MKKIKMTVAILSLVVLVNPALFVGNPGFISTAQADTGYTVSGMVLNPNGTPAANNPVGLHSADWSFSRWMGTCPENSLSWCGAVGTFKFTDIPAGTYLLEANPPFGTSGVTNAIPVTITVAGDTTGQNISLVAATKTISGTITKNDGTPVVGAMVNIWRFNGKGGSSVRTDASGNYSISISGGRWGINVNPDNGPGAPVADWVYEGPAKEVNFADDTTAQSETVNVTVVVAKATVVVTVIKTDGTPITSGHVDVRSNDGRGNGQPLDNTNVITLKVPAGSYFVQYFSQDGKYSVAPQSINAADNTTTNVTLTAKEKSAHIIGKVVNVNGIGLPNINLNVNCQPLGAANGPGAPGSFSNGTSGADGSFNILTNAGMCHLNVDQGFNNQEQAGPAYIYSGNPIDPNVTSETATVDVGSITLQLADATITGRVLDSSGNVINQVNGSAYARSVQTTASGPINEFNGPINNGRYTIKLPSKVFSIVQLGVHLPPNVQFSSRDNPTVTVVADSTITQDLVLAQNTSTIYGSVVTPNGIPLTACNPAGNATYFGQVFINSQAGNGYGTQIKPDCSYEISVGTGTYQFGYNLDQNSGFMNRPPSPDPIVVKDNDRIARNIIAVASDAKIRVTVLDPKGNKVPNVWVGADNHEEIVGGPMGDTGGQKGEGPKGIEDQKGPGGLDNPKDIMKYCSDAKHKAECEGDKLPSGTKGPGGCTNAYECSQFCSKPANEGECGKFFGGNNPQPGNKQPGGPQTGPGGCKTEAECKTYCAVPEHQSECSKFGPPKEQMTSAALSPIKAQEATMEKGEKVGMGQDNFDKQIHSGGQTDMNGSATIAVVSGHKYTVNNGLPPDSPYMQAAMQRCDLTTAKTCDLVMVLQASDVSVTGVVKIGTGVVTNGFVHAWSETGGFSGSPVNNNGTYKLNLNSGTTWHIGADSPQGRDFYRTEEVTLVASKAGKYSQNFQLSKNIVQLPDSVSTTFDATTQAVLTLNDGTTVTMPAGSIATSGTVTVTADPTVQINTTQTDQPAFGFGYEFKALQNGAEITKFAAATVSVQYKYDTAILEKLGISESALVPKFYNASSGAWEKPDNILQDTTNKTITVTGLAHFSIHSVVSTAGVKASKTSLVSVATAKNTKGETKVTVGSGSAFIPFKGYNGGVNIATASLGGTIGQVIVAAPSGTTKDVSKVIVYKVTGNKKKVTNVKKLKELVPVGGYKDGFNLSFSDVTQDDHEDIIVGTANGDGRVAVYNVYNKYRSSGIMKIGKKDFKGSTTVTVLEAYVKGQGALIAKAGDDLAVFKYNTKNAKFSRDTKYPASQKIKIAGNTVSMKDLRPKITSSVSTKFVADITKTAKVTVKGVNFTNKTVVLINNIAVTVKFKNATTLDLTLTPGSFKKGAAYRFQISNSEGSTTSGKITFK